MEPKEGKQESEQINPARGSTVEKETSPQTITDAKAFLIQKFTNFMDFLQERSADDKEVFGSLEPLFEKRKKLGLRIEQELMIFCSGYCTIAREEEYRKVIEKWENKWKEQTSVCVNPNALLTIWFDENVGDLDTLIVIIEKVYPLAHSLHLAKMKDNLVHIAKDGTKDGILKVFRLVRYLALWNSMLGGITLNG